MQRLLDQAQLPWVAHGTGRVDDEGERRVRPLASVVGAGPQTDPEDPQVAHAGHLVPARHARAVQGQREAVTGGLRVVLPEGVDELLRPYLRRLRSLTLLDEAADVPV